MTIAASPPPLAWYGSSFAYYDDPPAGPSEQELDAAAARERERRLAGFSPEQFGPRPGGGQDGAGVVLGRFLPVHDGHRYLIEHARLYCARVFVFVRVRADDPVPWPVRRDWLTELFPDVTVVPVPDDAADPADPRRWADAVRAVVVPDYLFSGENTAGGLARRLGAQLVPVSRFTLPVSGTQVRLDPWKWAHRLPAPVRAWYARRVCLIGAEGTGKSTLARRLAEHYGTLHVPEMFGIGGFAPRPAPADISRAAVMHEHTQRLMLRRAERVLFCDNNVLAVRLWSERLFGAAPDWVRDAAERDGTDLYLLTAPDLPFLGGVEHSAPAERADFHARCEAELVRLGRPYAVVSGSHEERFAQAVAAVDALLVR